MTTTGIRAELRRIAPVIYEKLVEFDALKQALSETESSFESELLHPDDVVGEQWIARAEEWLLTRTRGSIYPLIELLRNVFLVAPIIFTWLSLSLASAAFNQQSIKGSPTLPEASQPTFQQLWEKGFDIPSVDWGLIVNIPLTQLRSDGSEWRWFTFSFVAGTDAAIIAILGFFIIATHVIQARAETRVAWLMTGIEDEVRAFKTILRRHHVRAEIARSDVARVTIIESLNAFTTRATLVVATMTEGANMFRSAAEARLKGDGDLISASNKFVSGATQLEAFSRRIQEAYEEQTNQLQEVALALHSLQIEERSVGDTMRALVASLAEVSSDLGDATVRLEGVSKAFTRGSDLSADHLVAVTQTERELSRSANELARTTLRLADVLTETSDSVTKSSSGMIEGINATSGLVGQMLSDLSNRLDSASASTFSTVTAAGTISEQLARIAEAQMRSQRELVESSRDLLNALGSMLSEGAKRNDSR